MPRIRRFVVPFLAAACTVAAAVGCHGAPAVELPEVDEPVQPVTITRLSGHELPPLRQTLRISVDGTFVIRPVADETETAPVQMDTTIEFTAGGAAGPFGQPVLHLSTHTYEIVNASGPPAEPRRRTIEPTRYALLADGEVLIFRSATGEWVPAPREWITEYLDVGVRGELPPLLSLFPVMSRVNRTWRPGDRLSQRWQDTASRTEFGLRVPARSGLRESQLTYRGTATLAHTACAVFEVQRTFEFVVPTVPPFAGRMHGWLAVETATGRVVAASLRGTVNDTLSLDGQGSAASGSINGNVSIALELTPTPTPDGEAASTPRE